MARPATGSVVERKRACGAVYALRFRAYGVRRFVTLGDTSEGWTRARAETELSNVLADVRRGIWRPPEPEPAVQEPRRVPTFHEFASDWYTRRELEGLRPRTLRHLHWALSGHLLAHFASQRVDSITVEDVDRYVQAKAREGVLGPVSINRSVQVLAAVLEVAVEYGHLDRNPAMGRRRRLPTTKPRRLFLEPDQVRALLDAAGELDCEDRLRRPVRRPLLATLAYAGLRLGELTALRWENVDLAAGRIRVRASKTEAGVRTVDLQPELRDELSTWKATTRRPEPEAFVFSTHSGRERGAHSVRVRILLKAVERANERATRSGGEPLPDGLSPHALRRSFASWLVAEGEDPAYVMEQMGHTDPNMTLGLYAKALRSKRRRPHARRADANTEWAPLGTSAAAGPSEATENSLSAGQFAQ